uniref:Endoplasmic reticulum metallopeptidase 1-like C-terminal domain-containing protein n=1 Tax=Hanusia phi TaxID=3032 RepID=A0A7S0HNV4_9CRYP
MDTLALEPLRQLGVKDWQEAKAYPCRGLACSLPWFFPLADELQDGWLLPAKPPPIEEARRMKLAVSEEERESQGKRVILSLDGPSHMGIIISDPHHRVTAWNLNLLSSDTGSNDVQTRRKQDMYFIYFASGLASASSQLHPWKLSIDLRSDARGRDDVGVAAFGHYLLFEGKDGTDLPGCSFSDEARGFAAILPEHLKPICFYNILYNFTL